MLGIDNKAAISITRNPVLHRRSKHLRLAFHINREAFEAGLIDPYYISTDENTSGYPH